MEELETTTPEPTPRLRDKKVSDLTVGDSVKLAVLAPVIMIGGTAAVTAARQSVSTLTDKFRARRAAKKSASTNSVETSKAK